LVAALAPWGTGQARAEDVCLRITVTDFLTGTHTTGYTCAASPWMVDYYEYSTGLLPWIDVSIEVISPRLSSP
jgi:hypothetical protein